MTTYVALLRGINVGGHNKVPMAALRATLEALGFPSARTLLQSGNAVFDGPAQDTAGLEARLEKAAADRLGVACDIVVRTGAQWVALIAANPFPKEVEVDPSHLVAMCLKAAPTADAIVKLRETIKGPEQVEAVGRELYAWYPVDIGNSKLTNTMIEGRLGVRGTARNWNTVRKLAAML